MKTSHYLLLIGLMALAAAGGLASFMKAPEQSAGSPEHMLGFQADESDIWDESLADEPPLAPGAAIRAAVNFMRTIRLPDYTHSWLLDHLTLQRMSFSGGPEEWVYVADFYAGHAHNPEGPGPLIRFQVPVRFNGTVPEAFSARIPPEQRFRFWAEQLSAQ